MKRFLALLAVALLAWSPALAGPNLMPLMGVGSTVSAATYTGPGDIVSGATAWYGLRAYNAAYATGSNNAINVRRASDNTTQNIVILSNGNLDIATANTFAGTDATCTGTISTTTLTCASASSTPHAGSTLTGAGITQPSYIVSCGTFTGGAGTCTLNASQTVSVGEAITMQYGLYVAEMYDQTGNNRPVLQATAGSQPQLLPNCGNALPCVRTATLFLTSSATITASQPNITFSTVANRTGNTSGNSTVVASGSNLLLFQGANTAGLFAGSVVGATGATANAFHALNGVFNGASSIISIDNTNITISPGTNNISATTIELGDDGFSNPFTGYFTEAGIWSAQFNTTQLTNLCHNQFQYWGTATSC